MLLGDRSLFTRPDGLEHVWQVAGALPAGARIGANYQEIPVNAPKSPMHSYSKDGTMRHHTVSDPVYAPNSKGSPKADTGDPLPMPRGATPGQEPRQGGSDSRRGAWW